MHARSRSALPKLKTADAVKRAFDLLPPPGYNNPLIPPILGCCEADSDRRPNNRIALGRRCARFAGKISGNQCAVAHPRFFSIHRFPSQCLLFTQNRFLQRLVGGSLLERTYLNTISAVQLMFMKAPQGSGGCQIDPLQSRRGRQSLQTAYEQYFVYTFAAGCMHLPGIVAEVGVFQGVSARLLCDLKKDKPLHLFDTFEGLPNRTKKTGASTARNSSPPRSNRSRTS